jgi:MoaA/NifB/PqqE/SkfB family radical SAM enzyme
MKILENSDAKFIVSPDFNVYFNKNTGYTQTWGRDIDEDPQYSPFGPIIMDISISNKCFNNCQFCYRSLTPKGESMGLETFKKIFHKLPRTVTQIAFGLGDLFAAEDVFEIFQYTRDHGVIPNVTINGRITREEAEKLTSVCGAVSVSHYSDDACYSAVEMLSKAGLKQVNIHQLVSQETEDQCKQVLIDAKTDPRLKGLNAIVYLSLKRRGRGEGYHPLSKAKKFELFKLIQESGIGYGYDSCGSTSFLEYLKMTNQPELEQYVEPCESTCFSGYINVQGQFHACSFDENGEGLDVLTADDFIKDIWMNPKTVEWRTKLLNCGRNCPLYKLESEG